MKGIRFYEEFTNTTKKVSEGNVIAAFVANGTFWQSGKPCYETLDAVYFRPNSPVASSSISLDFLRRFCKRVSEARAREIHPALFERLDEEEA